MSRYAETVELMNHYKNEMDKLNQLDNFAYFIININNGILPLKCNNEVDILIKYIAEFIHDYYYSIDWNEENKDERKKYIREHLIEVDRIDAINKFLQMKKIISSKLFPVFSNDSEEIKIQKQKDAEDFFKIFEEKCDFQILDIYTTKRRMS